MLTKQKAKASGCTDATTECYQITGCVWFKLILQLTIIREVPCMPNIYTKYDYNTNNIDWNNKITRRIRQTEIYAWCHIFPHDCPAHPTAMPQPQLRQISISQVQVTLVQRTDVKHMTLKNRFRSHQIENQTIPVRRTDR